MMGVAEPGKWASLPLLKVKNALQMLTPDQTEELRRIVGEFKAQGFVPDEPTGARPGDPGQGPLPDWSSYEISTIRELILYRGSREKLGRLDAHGDIDRALKGVTQGLSGAVKEIRDHVVDGDFAEKLFGSPHRAGGVWVSGIAQRKGESNAEVNRRRDAFKKRMQPVLFKFLRNFTKNRFTIANYLIKQF